MWSSSVEISKNRQASGTHTNGTAASQNEASWKSQYFSIQVGLRDRSEIPIEGALLQGSCKVGDLNIYIVVVTNVALDKHGQNK